MTTIDESHFTTPDKDIIENVMLFKIIKFILKVLLSSNCTRFQLSFLFISYENCRARNVPLLADK